MFIRHKDNAIFHINKHSHNSTICRLINVADSKDYLSNIGKARDQIKTESDSPIHKIMQQWSKTAVEKMKEAAPKSAPPGNLASSIGFKPIVEGSTLIIEFTADDYWDYVNSGVEGVRGSAGAIENKFGQTYSFKTEVPGRSMVDAFMGKGKQNWLASKGITSITYGGETYQLSTEADYRAAAFVFARAVKRKGIKPSNFVGSAINEDSIKQLENLLIEALIKLL